PAGSTVRGVTDLRDTTAEPIQPRTPSAPEPHDPHVWLEDVDGDDALAWVRERNEEALATLGGPLLEEIRAQVLEVLDSEDKIPLVGQAGGHLYNFWTDARHERGLWRRTTLESYRTAEPEWEVLLDLDALSEAEGESWVWHGASVLRPDCTRALVDLSRGGSDADVTRELDLTTRTFVDTADGGFVRPEAKASVGRVDREPVVLATDTGAGSTTTSGYPRQVRRWRRGTPLEDAPVIYEGLVEDLLVHAFHDRTPGFERDVVVRAIDFYHQEVFLL